MAKELRSYQLDMINFMIEHPRCNIFAGMGLGKTVSVLTYLDALKSVCPEFLPALILAPLRVAKTVWPREAAEWPHLEGFTVVPVLGSAKERSAALRRSADAYSMNYENLEWLKEQLGKDPWPFPTVIADESTKLKGLRCHLRRYSKGGKTVLVAAGTKRARVLAKPAMQGIKRFVNLSGTPAPNGLTDLYGPQWLLDQGKRLGHSYSDFELRWFTKEFTGFGVEPLPNAQEEITAALKSCTMSLKVEDHFQLNAPITNTLAVELPPGARKLYEEMENKLFMELENGDEIEAFNAASKTTKLLQIAAGAVYVNDKGDWESVHDEKLDALQSVVEEAAGAPVLVAYHFKSDLAKLTKRFPQGRVLDKTDKIIEDWNDGKIPLLFAHPASAGHGLNLARGGNILVFYSLNWNLEEHEQIIERLGPVRQAQAGLNRNVFIHYILASGTLDYDVKERLEHKSSVQDAIRNAMKRKASCGQIL